MRAIFRIVTRGTGRMNGLKELTAQGRLPVEAAVADWWLGMVVVGGRVALAGSEHKAGPCDR